MTLNFGVALRLRLQEVQKGLGSSSLVLLASGLLLYFSLFFISFPKGSFLLKLNALNHSALDALFRYGTFWGDAILYIPVLVVLILFKRRSIGRLVGLLLTQTLFVRIFKDWLAKEAPRPRAFYTDEFFSKLHLVPGVDICTANSFPSGHTTTAFALSVFLILVFRPNKWISSALIFMAIIAGISRVYLLQHFMIDVVVGSLFGILSAVVVNLVSVKIYKINHSSVFPDDHQTTTAPSTFEMNAY